MNKQATQGKKINHSVSRRLTILIIFMIVALSSAMMLIGYIKLKETTEEYYYRIGKTTADIIALTVNADTLGKYSKHNVIDEDYLKTMAILRKAREKCDAKVLYVFTVAEDGVNYIYDTDTSGNSEVRLFDPFSYIDPNTGKPGRLYPEATEKQLRAGGNVDTIIGVTQYGWIITVTEPLYGSDGRCAGYLGIDFDVNQMIAERTTYLWQLATIIFIATAVFAVLYLYIIRNAIVKPITIMAKAADSFFVDISNSEKSIPESDILSMNINTGDELQSLAESLKSMVRKMDEYITNLNLATIKAETDALTSLYNRGAFEQRVSAILNLRPEKNQLNAFMMIDVDYFKTVNDQHGHAVGDMVLTKCAQVLRRVMREADVVGRLGGDEFAVFCKSIGSVSVAEDKARQIRAEWLKIIPLGDPKGITATIGISFTIENDQGYQELFLSADEALYRAKEAGRDGFATSLPHKNLPCKSSNTVA
ncbi:MAG: GGDEF domain-containing protein [Deltaproteobacteria bacterium]|nr:GGDEF domain-containing protein [Deltaproteobacteria bacterium]